MTDERAQLITRFSDPSTAAEFGLRCLGTRAGAELRASIGDLLADGQIRATPSLLRSAVGSPADRVLAHTQDTVWIRISHQPELFPAWKTLGQLLHGALLAREIRSLGLNAQLVLVLVDYDTTRDKGISRATLPRSTRRGNVSVVLPKALQTDRVVAVERTPANDWVESQATRAVREAAESYSSLVPHQERLRLREAANTVSDWVSTSHRDAVSLADMSARYQCSLVFALTREPVTIVSGYDLLAASQARLRELLGTWPDIKTALTQALQLLGMKPRVVGLSDLVWGLCQCGVRLQLAPSSDPRQLGATCPTCGADWSGESGTILPRVLLDDILDHERYASHVGLMHEGAIVHAPLGRLTAKRLGIRSEAVEFAFRARYRGPCFFRDALETSATTMQIAVDTELGNWSSLYYAIVLNFHEQFVPEDLGGIL